MPLIFSSCSSRAPKCAEWPAHTGRARHKPPGGTNCTRANCSHPNWVAPRATNCGARNPGWCYKGWAANCQRPSLCLRSGWVGKRNGHSASWSQSACLGSHASTRLDKQECTRTANTVNKYTCWAQRGIYASVGLNGRRFARTCNQKGVGRECTPLPPEEPRTGSSD